MATVIELERLRALVGQLVPLTTVQRGDVIRADSWNVVVGALVELARAVTALGTDRDVPEHEHTGDVSLDWLDPQLRQLIERGPLDDPIAVTRVQQVEQRALQLGRALDGVGGDLKGLRERLDEAVTRDLVRENSMVRVSQKVEGIADTRTDVAALRRTMATISESVEGAVSLRRSLEIDGRLIDVRTVTEKLSTLDDLRERLRLPTGQLLDAITIEQRLQQTENKFVSRDDLDDILKNRGGALSEDALQSLTAGLRAQLAGDVEGVEKKFTDSLSTELNTRFANIEDLVAKSVASSIPTLRETLAASVRTEILAEMKETTGKMQADFDLRIKSLREEIGLVVDKDLAVLQATVTKELDDMRTTIVTSDEVAKLVDASIGESIDKLDSKFTAQLESQRVSLMTTIDTRFATEIKAADTRTATAIADSEKRTSATIATMDTKNTQARATDQAATLKTVDSRIATEIAASEARGADSTKKAVDAGVAAGIKTFDATLDTRIQAGVSAGIKSLDATIDNRIQAGVSAGIKTFDATLDARIGSLVKKGIDAQVPAIIDASVTTRMAEVEKGLRASVRDEVKLALGNTGGTRLAGPTQPAVVVDDFTKIPNVGASLSKRLVDSGITTYKQLAGMKAADVATLLNKSQTDAAAIIKEAKRLAG